LLRRITLSRLSFQWQITLLGALAAVLLSAVLFASVVALQYTKSAVLTDETKHLSATTQDLVRRYSEYIGQERASTGSKPLRPLDEPLGEPSQEALALVSGSVLANAEDVDGGFYATSGDVLVGNMFPPRSMASAGSSSQALVEEGPVVLEVARQAALTRKSSQRVLTSSHNIILIEAMPVQEEQIYVGSAWTMKQLPSLPGSNRLRAYLVAVGLGAAALASVLLTLFVVRNLQKGVRKIEGGLRSLEQDLASQIQTTADPGEIQRIAQAINRLGATLKQNIEHEKQIEDRLRHSERLAALGRLIAGVAHEVRNPLATIRLRVQMCRRASTDKSVHDSCAIALEEIERLNGMVNRLLSFSQPVRLRAESLDLCRLVDQRLEIFRDRASQNGVKVVTNFADEIRRVDIDRERMAQVFDNLIQNAIEAMSDSGGTLWVGVTSSTMGGGTARVDFCDSGKGIDASVVNRVFEPFFTTKPSGTGLGLCICNELVRAHGGDIQIESVEGHGTSVHIVLPLVSNGTRVSAA
jgi:signal transduction histidine kinase